MVGINGTYNSKALLKFNNITPDYDSAVVNSAKLTLKYRNYYYPPSHSDSLGQTAFDIYKVLQQHDYTKITYDSINNSSIGTVSQGNYTGFLTADSQEVSITLNTSMVKDWLEYAADTNWANKNYGIALSPGGASNVIKAFYAATTASGLKPNLQVIVTKNSKTDTLNLSDAQSVSLVDGSPSAGSESFSTQSGIGYVQVLKFDLSHIPHTATINDAQIYLTIDSAHCLFSNQSVFSLYAGYISDTAVGTNTSLTVFPSAVSGSQQVIRVVKYLGSSPFQMWLDGQTNNGLEIYNAGLYSNLDLFAFFNINASNPAKRPRVIIKYTPRITP